MKRFLALFMAGLSAIVASQASAEVQNTLTVNQWVQPAQDGVLRGRVVVPMTNGTTRAVEGAVVTIVDRDNNITFSEAETSVTGEFVIKNVKPGAYSLNARGEGVFALCAMHVLASDMVGQVDFPAEAQIAAATVDFTTVKTAVIRYMPPTAGHTPAMNEAQISQIASAVTGEQSFRIAQMDGGMKGRLQAAGSDIKTAQATNVFILQDGDEVARTITETDGTFSIDTLPAGSYSLLAVGPSGLGLIGFELVDESRYETRTARTSTNGKRFVIRLPDGEPCCEELTMQVAPIADSHVLSSSVSAPTIVSPTPAPAISLPETSTPIYRSVAAGGGSSGGGGGALLGGGGGLSGIAGLAGVGAIVAITTTSDDDAVATAPAVSPAAPN